MELSQEIASKIFRLEGSVNHTVMNARAFSIGCETMRTVVIIGPSFDERGVTPKAE